MGKEGIIYFIQLSSAGGIRYLPLSIPSRKGVLLYQTMALIDGRAFQYLPHLLSVANIATLVHM